MSNPINRYPAIPSQLFAKNRKKLAQHLPPNSIAIIHANDIMPTGADGQMYFWQNNNLFYLSGINQEETILLLYPDAPKKEQQTILFLKKTTPHLAVWEGPKYTKQAAQQCSGIQSIHWLHQFEPTLHALLQQADNIYLHTDEHQPLSMPVETRNLRFITSCKKRYPLHNYKRLDPIMRRLRMIKDQIEIDLLRQAYTITAESLKTMFALVKPGIMEYELEASLVSTMLQQRASGFAYSPIIASGKNSCILHYTANNQACKAGDLLLLDVGARYANYSADITRVVPVSGTFTPRQKAVYKAVLHVLEQAKKLLIPGSNFTTYNQQIGTLMEKTLVELNLISLQDIREQDPNYPAYKKYFMHGTSHHLGLSTHDIANPHQPFAPGMVMTIEPGIYIPEEGFGIRLENGVVLRKDHVEDLVADLPLDPDAIEALIHAS